MAKKILFLLILLVAISLRFAFLSHVPPSASLDEATTGWNAYSILHTGRDEYGYFFPMLLRAYDDYRPALYMYLVVPFVKVFGLDVFSVRLPAAIMSVLTVIMAYFLTKNLFNKLKSRGMVALSVMLLLAISPWHVYLSRLGHEVNLGLTLVVAAILLFFVGLNKKNGWFTVASFGVFALSFYSYQSEKAFTPLIVLVLSLLFWKQLLAMRKQFFISLLLFAAISLPIFLVSLGPDSLLRLKATSIFTNNPQYEQSAKQLLVNKKNGNIFGEIINNRRIVTVEIFVQNYMKQFNPYWYFGNTGDEQFKAPNTGLMYVWEAPFLLLGLVYFFLAKDFDKKIKIFLACWVLADFVAPGITTQAPHAMRAYTLLPLPQIFVSLGIIYFFTSVSKKSKGISFGFVVLLSVIALQSLLQFVNNYFVVFPYRQSQEFQYAFASAVPFIQQNKDKQQQVIVSQTNRMQGAYMQYLFYTKYDPKKYLAAGGTRDGGFLADHVIDNITFRDIDWNSDVKVHALFVGRPQDFPAHLVPQLTFYNLNGKPGIEIVPN